MDNRIFRMNGCGVETLEVALRLATDGKSIKGYAIDRICGLVFLWADTTTPETCISSGKFPVAISTAVASQIAADWLATDEAWKTPLDEWCDDHDHDGHNSKGWLVYVEDWGHVEPYGWQTACAVKPCYLWHGK